MDTITSVLDQLKKKGQDSEFTVTNRGLILLKGKLYATSDISLIPTYRFEEDTNPGEQAIIYLIKANDGVIGYSLDAYGIYTNHGHGGYGEAIHQMVRTE